MPAQGLADSKPRAPLGQDHFFFAIFFLLAFVHHSWQRANEDKGMRAEKGDFLQFVSSQGIRRVFGQTEQSAPQPVLRVA